MHRRIALSFVIAAAAGTAACGGNQPAETSPSPAAAEPTLRRDRNVILAEDMLKVQAINLYEVVQRIHPEWLTVRSTSTTGQLKGATMSTDTQVQVYVDTQRAGTVDMLKSMQVRSASAMRYYSASDAQVRFGSGNLSGAIQVITTMK